MVQFMQSHALTPL